MLSSRFVARPKTRLANVIYSVSAMFYPKYKRFWGEPHPVVVSKLRPGDVMLSKGPVGVRNAIGGMFFGSPFSHAAVYVGGGIFVDTSAAKVRKVHAEHLLKKYRSPFIFRARLSPNQRQKIAACALAIAKRGEPFSRPAVRAIRFTEISGFKFRRPHNKGKGLACTSMVAKVFADAGVVLVPGVDPLWVGPSHLLRSGKLKPINA